MRLFDARNNIKSAKNRRIYTIYQLIYTLVDFGAAMLFLIGSVLFFYQSLQDPAIWCFVAGSVLFATKPTLRLVREVHYLVAGDASENADSAAG